MVNLLAVVLFAISMLIGNNFSSYLSSMFIAFSFVVMISAYAYFSNDEHKLAGVISLTFAVIYAVIICLVYFAQLTTIHKGGLTQQASDLLDFQKFGLYFNYDMLGYAMMALSTFFAGLTVGTKSKADKCLKTLLMIHGIFFISCFIAPMLGIFTADGDPWIGVALLEFWCLYFIPVSVLSFFNFKRRKVEAGT